MVSTIKHAAGFSLLGIMLSAFIISTGITALLQLSLTSAINSQYSRNAATALHYARSRLEQLSFSLHSSDMPPAPSGHDLVQVDVLQLTCQWQVQTTESGNLAAISVSVDWRDIAGQHSISLTSAAGKI